MLAGCPPQPPPGPSSSAVTYDIEIRSHGNLVFGDVLSSTNTSWEWGPGSIQPVPTFELLGSNDLSARLRLAGSSISSQNLAQLALFARDPREVTDTLDTTFDPTVWEATTNPCALPGVRFVTAESIPNAAYQEGSTTAPIVTGDFWTDPPCATGPGAVPDGHGSIKSMRTYREGLCRASVPLGPIVQQIVGSLKQELAGAVLKAPYCSDAFVQYMDTTTYLSHQSTASDRLPDAVPSGGFSLLFGSQFHHYLPIPDTFTQVSYRYELRLSDGRLTAAPFKNELAAQGYSASDAITALQGGLENDIPAAINQASDFSQVIAPALENNQTTCTQDEECGPSEGCLPSPTLPGKRTCQHYTLGTCEPETDPSTGKPVSSITADLLLCKGARDLFRTAIDRGADQLGLSSADKGALEATADHFTLQKYDNWRCRQPTNGRDDPTEHYRCEYVVRAKRLNVYPEKVDLVFFDEKELQNEAYAAYVALASLGATSQMCTSGPDTTAYRAFYGSDNPHDEQLVVAKYRDAITCVGNNPGYFWDKLTPWQYYFFGVLAGLSLAP